MKTGALVVKNMENETDANKVLGAIEQVWGLTSAEVHFSRKEAVYSYDERMASEQDFRQAVIDAGFTITD